MIAVFSKLFAHLQKQPRETHAFSKQTRGHNAAIDAIHRLTFEVHGQDFPRLLLLLLPCFARGCLNKGMRVSRFCFAIVHTTRETQSFVAQCRAGLLIPIAFSRVLCTGSNTTSRENRPFFQTTSGRANGHQCLS